MLVFLSASTAALSVLSHKDTQMQVTVEELAMLLGTKDIEIYSLQKQVASLQQKLAEVQPKPEPELKAVS